MKGKFYQSITFRIGITLFGAILVAELLAGVIWYQTSAASREVSAQHTLMNVAEAASETYLYFESLPKNYRHLILNQLRESSGTRFFISINQNPLNIDPIQDISLLPRLTGFVEQAITNQFSGLSNVRVVITDKDNIRLFNSGIRLSELPEIWTRYSLSLGELDLPILVMQLEMAENEWFYIASAIPLPESVLTEPIISQRQLIFLFLASVMLMLCISQIIRRELKPVKSLAKAAALTGSPLSLPELEESGSNETRSAIHAFNKMSRRVKAYIRDREMLFSALSHDLKTPLACLKLRTEMLENDTTKKQFEKLLNEVDIMLTGALQCLRETNIHEESEWLDLQTLLGDCAEYFNQQAERNCRLEPRTLNSWGNPNSWGNLFPSVNIRCEQPVSLLAKPLALKRCIFNVVENAVKYGERVEIDVCEQQSSILLTFRDYGPGIPKKMQEKVFEPYCRAGRKDANGSGLGLTIARSIARTQGGDLVLKNHAAQGLIVELTLSRNS
ncbi:ATP-binding protein [Photobacterium sp. GSS17]|uniref:ATP-binding protein n=1 Tax=Photobacterium sp. GSS17 TaxID=3020715 RepID=UPI002360639E|nr:ATP-binding protein [Photobacterium sp. GSS17]